MLLLLQDGSDVLQFQRFRVFHPLPKQAHHGILKTLWDKRVQWNQGLNARRTKQLLQAFLDQDVRLGIPSQALPLPATAPRPAVSALPATSAATPASAAAKTSSSPSVTVSSVAPPADEVASLPQSDAQTTTTGASRVASSVHSPVSSPGKPLAPGGSVGGSTPVAKQPHQRKARDPEAAANRKLALPSSEGQSAADPSEGAPHLQPDFHPLTPTSTADHHDAVHAVAGHDNPPATSSEMPPSDVEQMPGEVLPSLPPLHLSKAQHRSVRTDDGEEVHVLVSPVRSQGGDDSPSSPSRLPDSVLKAMCNMGKAFLSR